MVFEDVMGEVGFEEFETSATRDLSFDGGRWEGLGGSREVWMQRPLDIHFLPALRSTFDDLEIPCQRFSARIIHLPRSFVTDPGMRSSSAGIYPHDMLETEIIS